MSRGREKAINDREKATDEIDSLVSSKRLLPSYLLPLFCCSHLIASKEKRGKERREGGHEITSSARLSKENKINKRKLSVHNCFTFVGRFYFRLKFETLSDSERGTVQILGHSLAWKWTSHRRSTDSFRQSITKHISWNVGEKCLVFVYCSLLPHALPHHLVLSYRCLCIVFINTLLYYYHTFCNISNLQSHKWALCPSLCATPFWPSYLLLFSLNLALMDALIGACALTTSACVRRAWQALIAHRMCDLTSLLCIL